MGSWGVVSVCRGRGRGEWGIGDEFVWQMPNGYNREKGKTGRTREEGWGRGGGEGRMESESVRRERRMESARGHVHLTSGRARVHTQQFRFLGCFFLCTKHPPHSTSLAICCAL